MASQFGNGYIGGDLSMRERYERYVKPKLSILPVEHAEWPYQCRCGTLGFVTYRGRQYCPRCGRRYTVRGLKTIRQFIEARRIH